MSFGNKGVKDTSAVDEAADSDNRRYAQRRSVLWPAILHIGDHQFNCQIRNFSMTGLKLKFNLPLKEGTVVKIEIPKRNIVLRADISWQADELLGIRFLEKKEVVKDIFGERAAVMGIGAKELMDAIEGPAA